MVLAMTRRRHPRARAGHTEQRHRRATARLARGPGEDAEGQAQAARGWGRHHHRVAPEREQPGLDVGATEPGPSQPGPAPQHDL